MYRILLLAVLSLGAAQSQALQTQRLVGFECDPQNDRLVVTYRATENDLTAVNTRTTNAAEWDPEQLFSAPFEAEASDGSQLVEGVCTLPHGTYQVVIGPVLGDLFVQGECSEAATAWVQVKRGAKVILPRYQFEGGCMDTETPITSRITFTKSKLKGEFTRVSDQEFFK